MDLLKKNFDNSTVEFVNSDLYFSIDRGYDFKLDEFVKVNITSSNLKNKTYNEQYVFEIEKSYPVLIKSNLNQVIKEHSLLYLEFADSTSTINSSSLYLSIDEEVVIQNGSFSSFFNIGDSSIENEENLIIKIDHPEFLETQNII